MRGTRVRRGGRAVGAAVLVAAAVAVAAPSAARAADETYLRPASGTFPLAGRGYGHGHGMSQYGAKGAAEAGLTWQQIMAFYYPGTAIGAIGGPGNNPLLRVRLTGLSTTPVVARPGLRVDLDRTGTPTTWQALPTSITRRGVAYTVDQWDVAWYADTDGAAPDLSGWYVRWSPTGSGGFNNYTAIPATALTTAFDNPTDGWVRRGTPTSYSTYRGELRHVRSAATAGASVTVVDALPMESYLRGVVPNEMPASWSPQAVRSQAVAARTYAEYERLHAPSGRAWDTCDTTSCQVMRPVETEAAAADAAISATAGQVVTYSGSAAFTQFSASNGGYMVAGSQPYLVAKADPYDTYSWTASTTATSLERTWPSIGRLVSLSLTRDGRGPWGGRVTYVTLRGSSATVSVTGGAFASALGLRSTLFKPESVPVSAPSFPKDATSDGRGDVVAVTRDGRVRVYPGAGGGAFAAPVADPVTSLTGQKALVAGTWDQDAVTDLLAVGDADGVLRSYHGKGNGTFGPPVVLGSGYGGYSLLTTVGDLNGDGGTDVVGRRSDGTLWLHEGDGQGGILGNVQIGNGWGGFTTIVSPGDFDGDGFTDLMGIDASGNLRLYRGAGHATFHAGVVIGWGWGAFTSVTSPGDFDGNGTADVLARRTDGALLLYPGTGTGAFGRGRVVGSGWNSLDILR